MRRWLSRLAVPAAVIAAGLFSLSPAAWADTLINVNNSGVNVFAADVEQNCDLGGGPLAGEDIWVFVLPKNNGVFDSLTATFGANGNVTVTRPSANFVDDNGTSKVWITTPAGWELTGASAEVTGTATFFTLTHACAASTTTTTTKPPTSRTTTTTTTTTTSSTTGTQTSPGGGTSSTGGGGSLPTTGVAVTGYVLAGLALIGGGIGALMIARRRQDAKTTTL